MESRQKTGRGQFVDVSMLDGVTWLMALPLAVYSAMGETPTMLSGRYACYQTYQAEDGRWLAAGALEPKFWAALCGKLGCPEFIPDQFREGERQVEIIESLRRIFRTKSAAEWLELFHGSELCVTLVRNEQK